MKSLFSPVGLASIFFAVTLAISVFADTVVFQNQKTLEVKSFDIISTESIRLHLDEGTLTVPARWVKKIILKQITRKPVPAPREQLIPYQQLIIKYSSLYGVDWRLIASMIEQESGFNPWAVSHRGAVGLMQLLPSTGRLFGVSDLFDPEQNLRAGINYILYLLNRYDGDLEKALAAYNAGPAVVDRYQGIPPYSETRWYVQNILARYEQWIRETEEVPAE